MILIRTTPTHSSLSMASKLETLLKIFQRMISQLKGSSLGPKGKKGDIGGNVFGTKWEKVDVNHWAFSTLSGDAVLAITDYQGLSWWTIEKIIIEVGEERGELKLIFFAKDLYQNHCKSPRTSTIIIKKIKGPYHHLLMLIPSGILKRCWLGTYCWFFCVSSKTSH